MNLSLVLWFDVEQRYKAIAIHPMFVLSQLWFDVEQRYKAIHPEDTHKADSCGLM